MGKKGRGKRTYCQETKQFTDSKMTQILELPDADFKITVNNYN